MIRKEQLSLQADPFPSGKGQQTDQAAGRLPERRGLRPQLSPDAPAPAVNVIARKQLVSAVPGQGHGHMLPGHAAHQVCGDLGGISEGLREHGGKPRDHLSGLLFRDGQAHVIRSQMGGDPLRRVRLVVFLFFHADGEGANPSGSQILHQGNHGAAVDSRRQEGSHRNIRFHLAFDGLLQEPLQLVRRFLPASLKRAAKALFRRLPHGPVGHNLRLRCQGFRSGRNFDGQKASRRKLSDVFIDAAGRGDIAVGKIKGKDASVDPPLKAVQHGDASQVGSEDEASRYPAVIQGLFSHPVPRQGQGAFLPVPEGRGEHPLTEGEGPLHAPAFRRLQKRLRIRASPEGRYTPFLQEPSGDFLMVINLPVKGDHIPAASRPHGLRPCFRQIDDGQPSVAKRHAAVLFRPQPGAVRPSVPHALAHSVQIAFPVSPPAAQARNSAHGFLLFPPPSDGPRFHPHSASSRTLKSFFSIRSWIVAFASSSSFDHLS